MANFGTVTVTVDMRLVPDTETVALALKILDLWQEENEMQKVIFDDADRHYKIIETV